MNEALQQALALLDESCALIQELVAQLQAKQGGQDMTKKAESLAAKMNVSFEEASDMIKEASEKGADVDLMIKQASLLNRTQSFGRVASEDYQMTKTGSAAMDKFQEREAQILSELGI